MLIVNNTVPVLLRQSWFYELSFLFQKTENKSIFVIENSVIYVFCFLCSAALGVGFYGNNKTQDGMKVLATSAIKIYNKFDLYTFEVSIINSFLSLTIPWKWLQNNIVITSLIVIKPWPVNTWKLLRLFHIFIIVPTSSFRKFGNLMKFGRFSDFDS